MCEGLRSSEMYVKEAKAAEMERRKKKTSSKKRPTKSEKHRRRNVVDDDDQEDDIPTAHVVSTAIDAPEVPK